MAVQLEEWVERNLIYFFRGIRKVFHENLLSFNCVYVLTRNRRNRETGSTLHLTRTCISTRVNSYAASLA